MRILIAILLISFSASAQVMLPNAGTHVTVSGGSFDTDAQAFITAAGITDATQQSAVNQLVLDLKSYSIWTKFYAIYPIVGGTATTHKYNLKDPRDLDAAYRLTFPNGATHSSTGVDWNGTNQYANTFFQPSTNGFTTTSGGFSYYSREDQAAGAVIEMGAVGAGGQQQALGLKYSGTLLAVLYGTGSSGTTSNASATGFFDGQQSGSNVEGYKAGTRIINAANTASLAATTMFIGAFSNNGSPSAYTSKQCAFAAIHSTLTTTEEANYYTVVQAYETTLSRQL